MKIFKSFITVLLAICMVLSLNVTANAAKVTVPDPTPMNEGDTYTFGGDDFIVRFNGEAVAFPDAQPYVDAANRTLVPVRFVSEKMGATVEWDNKTRTATISKDGITVDVTIGKKELAVTKDGVSSTVPMDTEAVANEGRTFVPVRFVAEALGAYVDYSNLFNTAQIYDDVLTPEEITRLRAYHDEDFAEWQIACGETPDYEFSANRAVRNPEYKFFSGECEYGFANANEWLVGDGHTYCYRNAAGEYVGNSPFEGGSDSEVHSCKINYDRVGALSGAYFKAGDPLPKLAEVAIAEAKACVGEYKINGESVVSFKTDLSCVFVSKHRLNGIYAIRGIATAKMPANATAQDIAAVRDTFGYEVKAGETLEFDTEVYILLECNNSIAMEDCIYTREGEDNYSRIIK